MKPSIVRRPRYRRRTYRRRYTKPSNNGWVRRVVRSTAIQSFSVPSAASFNGVNFNVQLNQVQTSDLTAAYRLYRIRKCVVYVVPRFDTANSGIVNNAQVMFAAACDPEDLAAPTSITQVTAYENSYQKLIPSGDHFKYTFYPKVVNAVQGAPGNARYVGSYGINPWLTLGSGVDIPHQSLKLAAQFANVTSTAIPFDYYVDIHFDVKGAA